MYFYVGEYHKYDSIAYPKYKRKNKSLMERLYGNFYGNLYGTIREKRDEEDFVPLSHQEMSEFCLECYLLRIKEMLCSGSFPDGQDIYSIALDISFIFESFLVEYVSAIDDPIYRTRSLRRQVNLEEVNQCTYGLYMYSGTSE